MKDLIEETILVAVSLTALEVPTVKFVAEKESYDEHESSSAVTDRHSNVEDVLLSINQRWIDKSNIQNSRALINL